MEEASETADERSHAPNEAGSEGAPHASEEAQWEEDEAQVMGQSEGDTLTKEHLISIIEEQAKALEALRKEVEVLRKGGDVAPPCGGRKRDMDEEEDGMTSALRCTEDAGHQIRREAPDLEERNAWAPRRLGRLWGVRQPLARSVLAEQANSVIPALPSYDGTSDPEDHLNNYFTKMQLYNSSDATLCRAFPSTFVGVVLDWYHQIEEGRIDSFEQFAAMFLSKFASRKRRSLTISALFKVRQRKGEALRDFYERWMSVAMAVKDVKPPVLGCCLDECTNSEELCRALSKRDVVSTEDLDRRVQKVIMLEETLAARRLEQRETRPDEAEAARTPRPTPAMQGAQGYPQKARRPEPSRFPPRSATNFTELNDTLRNVLQYARDK
ncbi:unnamed protein product [Linum trigynum]|uniref:Retrotransposon gag domain-containing protein n=1 Tax=Linum trigynum TaxID=586398 RepID=A0AAV2D739_9ROSI